MTRFLACCLILFAFSSTLAKDVAPNDVLRLPTDQGTLLHSTTTGAALLGREAAGPDTFDLYGGPQNLVRDPDGVPGSGDEYVEGKFQSPDGSSPAGLSASPGDWTGQDLTEVEDYWQVDTFNAENLGGHGPGNRAMWCGIRADDPRAAGWTDAPGYGNNWSERLIFEQVVSDPSVGQTVDLDLVFNHDTELAYDFLQISYDAGTTWQNDIYFESGTTSLAAPGTRLSDVATGPITYAPNDYWQGDKIRIVIEFWSDGAYSDEDGLFVGNGAVQLDDIVVTTSEGTFTEDFEGPGPYVFDVERTPFFGDFANVFLFTSDLDPCAENTSPQLNFVDRGQAPPNGPGVTGIVSTGGETWPDWNYGSPGGWVLNWHNGIAGGGSSLYLDNRAVSPPIDWDLPGAADDDPAFVGAKLAFDVWQHLPLQYPFYYTWQIRSKVAGLWESWRDYSLFNYGTTASYRRYESDVTPLIEPGVEQVQVRLGVFDYSFAIFTPNPGATPGPWFDNVRLSKYRVGGPSISTSRAHLANDAFPVSGLLDASSQSARDALDVRFDMAQSIAYDDAVVPGDSLVINVDPVIPGSSVSEVRLRWVLRQNDLFEAAIRSAPSRPGVDLAFQTGVAGDGSTVWSGTVVMENHLVGSTPTNNWSGDLPDEDFLYPGDVLHYYFEAVDDQGRTSTLPADLSGFGAWDALGRSTYSRMYTVRALPSLKDDTNDQPEILWVDDAGFFGHEEEEWITAFETLGLVEGRDFDSYTVRGARAGVGNGIGAAGRDNGLGERRGHGASLEQLSAYTTLFYETGDLDSELLGAGGVGADDEPGDDIGLLTDWKNAAGTRASIWFGDDFASSVGSSSVPGQGFVANVMGVSVVGDDLRDAFPAATNPQVVPTGTVPAFGGEFFAYGICPLQRAFDDIRPAGAALRSHGLQLEGGSLAPDLALGVVFDRLDGGVDRKLDVTFPFALQSVLPAGVSGSGSPASARSLLLEEVLLLIDAGFVPGTPVSTPRPRTVSLEVAPTPFNPSTVVTFTLPRVGAVATVKVYDVRGALVRTLHDGHSSAAELRLEWNGRDDAGAAVGSGVYFVRGVTDGFDQTRKVMLVK